MSKFVSAAIVITWGYLMVVLTIFVFTGVDLLEDWSKARIAALMVWPLVVAFVYGMLKGAYERIWRWYSRQKR